jgi:hypothetical protein
MYKILYIPTGEFIYKLELGYYCIGEPPNDSYKLINRLDKCIAEYDMQNLIKYGAFISYDNYENHVSIKPYENEFEIVETKPL